MPILDDLIQQTADEYAKENARKNNERMKADQVAEDAIVLELHNAFIVEFGTDLIDALKPQFTISPKNHAFARAAFDDGEAHWTIILTGHPGDRRRMWDLNARFESESLGLRPAFDTQVTMGEARKMLLLGLYAVRQKAQEIARKAEQKRIEIEADRQNAQNYKAKKAIEAAERQRVSDEIAQEVEDRLQAERELLWRWPENTTIVFYKMSWCCGAVRGDDDDVVCDYDRGYTVFPQLFDVTTVYGLYYHQKPRSLVNLSMEFHKPIWDRIEVASIGDLPQDLLKTVNVQIDDICYGDMGYYWRDERNYLRREVGKIPTDWVRELAEVGGAAVITVEWIAPGRYYLYGETWRWHYQRHDDPLLETPRSVAYFHEAPSNANSYPLPSPFVVIDLQASIEVACAQLDLPVATHYSGLTLRQRDGLRVICDRLRLPYGSSEIEHRRLWRKPLLSYTFCSPLTNRNHVYRGKL